MPVRSGTASGGQLFVKSWAKTFHLRGGFIEWNFLFDRVFSLYDAVLMVNVKCGDVTPIRKKREKGMDSLYRAFAVGNVRGGLFFSQ